jgi:hypothetical protein
MVKGFCLTLTIDTKVNKKQIGFKIITWKFYIGISTGTKMVEAPESESYKQKIPDFSRTCLAACWMCFS